MLARMYTHVRTGVYTHTQHVHTSDYATSPLPTPKHTHTLTNHVTSIKYPVEDKVLIGLIEGSSVCLARASVWVDWNPLGSLEVSETRPLELVHPGNGTCTGIKQKQMQSAQ